MLYPLLYLFINCFKIVSHFAVSRGGSTVGANVSPRISGAFGVVASMMSLCVIPGGSELGSSDNTDAFGITTKSLSGATRVDNAHMTWVS